MFQNKKRFLRINKVAPILTSGESHGHRSNKSHSNEPIILQSLPGTRFAMTSQSMITQLPILTAWCYTTMWCA